MSQEENCFLCRQKAIRKDNDYGNKFIYTCQNCGEYVLTASLEQALRSDPPKAFRLACVLRDRKIRGLKHSLNIVREAQNASVTMADEAQQQVSLEEVLSSFPEPAEIIDRAVLNLSLLATHPMDTIEPETASLPFLLFCPLSRMWTAYWTTCTRWT